MQNQTVVGLEPTVIHSFIHVGPNGTLYFILLSIINFRVRVLSF